MDLQQRHLAPEANGLRFKSTPARPTNAIPSSSPAFATPLHPVRPVVTSGTATTRAAPILPIALPATTLRPVAFRTFTKRHNLTITSSSLQALATFVGKYCGSGWREEGLAEKVLEDVARRWKKGGGGLIVDGESKDFQAILKQLGECMVGGKIAQTSGLSRQSSGITETSLAVSSLDLSTDPPQHANLAATPQPSDDVDIEDINYDPRHYLKVISAFDQPRLLYNPTRRHFERISRPPSLFPDAVTKTAFFKNRYHVVHQRLMRNENFQEASIAPQRRHDPHSLQRSASSFTPQQAYKMTQIANLLGRDGSFHTILGLLSISPMGTLAISDLTGSIALDLNRALPSPVKDAGWFTPGMMVIAEGTYVEEGGYGMASLGSSSGVGGTIGGDFVASAIGGPPCERRSLSLGTVTAHYKDEFSAASGFGWVDFLDVGSEKTVGTKMRRLEKAVLKSGKGTETEGRAKIVIVGELNLDNPETIEGLKKILGQYNTTETESLPMAVILIGNFVSSAAMIRAGLGNSMDYKEHFDALAAALSEFPAILQAATFVFVPGANDPWAASFSASAATCLPQKGIPAVLTSRVRRVFTAANADSDRTKTSGLDGEPIFSTNPARISLFGPSHELVVFRDDMSGRLRRNALRFPALVGIDTEAPGGTLESGFPGVEAMELDRDIAAAESHQPEPEPQTKITANVVNDEDVVTARKLVKTVLDQSYLSPFPISTRPVLWDYAGALHLYPMPTALVLMDPEAPPFAMGYEGCHVMNPGRCLAEQRKGLARWVEYDATTRKGTLMEVHF